VSYNGKHIAKQLPYKKKQAETLYIGICQANEYVKNVSNLFLIAFPIPATIREKCRIAITTHVVDATANCPRHEKLCKVTGVLVCSLAWNAKS